ncbi:hypothetical protein [Winslowiella iniecta]|uniref:hypothetical protein n=1 Tax=Winslowiella iniecta TaxID=1560201 RepID=UPI000AD0B285|nr:hypothetical protein [Winslowiella iniecta]
MTTQPYSQTHNSFSPISSDAELPNGVLIFNSPMNNFHDNNMLDPVFLLALIYCLLDITEDRGKSLCIFTCEDQKKLKS